MHVLSVLPILKQTEISVSVIQDINLKMIHVLKLLPNVESTRFSKELLVSVNQHFPNLEEFARALLTPNLLTVHVNVTVDLLWSTMFAKLQPINVQLSQLGMVLSVSVLQTIMI